MFGLTLGLTSGTLAVAHGVNPVPPAVVEVTVQVAANTAATLMRFRLLRRWVFRRD